MNARERVLKMFAGQAVDRPPCFSGMGNVTTEGLKKLNQNFAATHLDAKMMAAAAASTYKLFGFECGIAPFDLCIEAEARVEARSLKETARWCDGRRSAGCWRARPCHC